MRLFTCLLGLADLMLALSFSGPALSKPLEIPTEWTKCRRMQDCILVANVCNLRAVSIHRDFAEAYERSRQDHARTHEYECQRPTAVQDTVAQCVGQKCTTETYGPKTERSQLGDKPCKAEADCGPKGACQVIAVHTESADFFRPKGKCIEGANVEARCTRQDGKGQHIGGCGQYLTDKGCRSICVN